MQSNDFRKKKTFDSAENDITLSASIKSKKKMMFFAIKSDFICTIHSQLHAIEMEKRDSIRKTDKKKVTSL